MIGKIAFYNHFRSMGYAVCQTTNKLIKKLNNDLVLELLPNDDGSSTMVVITFDEVYIRLFDTLSVSVTDFESKAYAIYSAMRKIQ